MAESNERSAEVIFFRDLLTSAATRRALADRAIKKAWRLNCASIEEIHDLLELTNALKSMTVRAYPKKELAIRKIKSATGYSGESDYVVGFLDQDEELTGTKLTPHEDGIGLEGLVGRDSTEWVLLGLDASGERNFVVTGCELGEEIEHARKVILEAMTVLDINTRDTVLSYIEEKYGIDPSVFEEAMRWLIASKQILEGNGQLLGPIVPNFTLSEL